jgi:hypothetical protein
MRSRLPCIVAPLRRQVLSSPAVELLSTRRQRQRDGLPFLVVLDTLRCTIGSASCLARLTFWRGDVVDVRVMSGDPAALPLAVKERLQELQAIKRVVAEHHQGAAHGA